PRSHFDAGTLLARLWGVECPRPFVAVVDDDESVRRALGRLLRISGLEAGTFASGPALIEELERRKPDCVVLDLNMPGMSGSEVQNVLAQRGHRIPVVILTGQDSPEALARATAGGAAAYLCKPVDAKVLLAAVAAAMNP